MTTERDWTKADELVRRWAKAAKERFPGLEFMAVEATGEEGPFLAIDVKDQDFLRASASNPQPTDDFDALRQVGGMHVNLGPRGKPYICRTWGAGQRHHGELGAILAEMFKEKRA